VDEHHRFNRRAHERYCLPAAYTSVEARRTRQSAGQRLTGHAYDVSEGGVRVELDEPLMQGEPVQLRLNLPGERVPVSANANVVWINDELDDPGPRRMAFAFREFSTFADRERLLRFMGHGGLRVAA
jgi:hypothetical protein